MDTSNLRAICEYQAPGLMLICRFWDSAKGFGLRYQWFDGSTLGAFDLFPDEVAPLYGSSMPPNSILSSLQGPSGDYYMAVRAEMQRHHDPSGSCRCMRCSYPKNPAFELAEA